MRSLSLLAGSTVQKLNIAQASLMATKIMNICITVYPSLGKRPASITKDNKGESRLQQYILTQGTS